MPMICMSPSAQCTSQCPAFIIRVLGLNSGPQACKTNNLQTGLSSHPPFSQFKNSVWSEAFWNILLTAQVICQVSCVISKIKYLAHAFLHPPETHNWAFAWRWSLKPCATYGCYSCGCHCHCDCISLLAWLMFSYLVSVQLSLKVRRKEQCDT